MIQKQFFRAALLAALTLGLAASCTQKENLEPQVPETPETPAETVKSSVITATVSDEMTKVALSDAGVGAGLSMAWEATDKLTVIGNTTETFTIKEGFDAHSAEFDGTPVDGTSYTILYPGQTYSTVEAINARSYTSQVQDGNGGTSHLEWNAKIAGVADYSTLQFYDNANLVQNGALKFRLQLPAAFTKVYSVALKAPSAIFSTTNGGGSTTDELKLTLKTGSADGVDISGDANILTAFMMVSWNETAIAAGTELTVEVKGDQEDPWTKVKTVGEGGFTIAGGKVTTVQLNKEDWTEPLFWGGSGTSGDPYQIKTATHLQNMNNKISEVAGANTLYFKLVDDIDLNGVSLDYSNGASANKYPIDFDGDGHTISNYNKTNKTASLFGKLNGAVYNVKFKDATVTPAATSSGGLLAFRAGDADSPVSIHDITVDGLTLTWENTTSSNTTVVGGLVGYLTNGQVYNVTVTNLSIAATGNNVGGIVGKTETAASTISSCTVSGSVSGLRYVGGILGLSDVAGTTVSGCTSSGTVTGNSSGAADTGGIVGRANNTLSVESCTSSADVTAYSQLGGIIGSANGTVSKCASSGKITTLAAAASGNASAYTGGIAGFNNGSLEVSECCFTGKITGTVNSIHVGGIVGCQYGSNALTLRNCYSSGSITTTRAYTGGLLGQVQNGKITVSNCYSSMAMTAGQGSVNGLGGLIGGSNGTTAEWNVSGCLAWHSKIEFNMTAKADRSYDGVIVGQMHSGSSTASTSFTNCYYRNDLDYTGYKTDGVSRTPLDEDDLTKSVGKGYYDGHRAAAGVSCSAQATALGWSAEIWNLTGDYPTLKNLPQ